MINKIAALIGNVVMYVGILLVLLFVLAMCGGVNPNAGY